MKKGIIYIVGQVGSYQDKNGEMQKGVELVDVIAQVKAAGEVDEYVALVNGWGGLVDTGYQIHDYLKSLSKPLSSVVYNQSASIDTIISLAAKKGKRFIVKGAEFFVHNPWATTQGDAASLFNTAEELQKIEDKMVSFYSRNAGITKEGITHLLKNETALTPEEAVALGFADSVITEDEAKDMGIELKSKAKVKALALIEPKKTDNMSTFKEELSAFGTEMKSFMKSVLKIKAEDKKSSLELKTNDGKTLSVETEEKEVKVGDIVSCEGKQVSEKIYVLADGRTVKVNEKSEIMEILPSDSEKVDQAEYVKVKSELDALKLEVSNLKKERLESEKEFVAIKTNFQAIAKTIASTHEPEVQESTFRKVKTGEESDVVLAAQARSKKVKEAKRKQYETQN